MTDHEKQRIKLAEFVGTDPGYTSTFSAGNVPIFDPRNDANDCEALIRKLNETGRFITITHHPDGQADMKLSDTNSATSHYSGYVDDWKYGVCDLAVKVIDNE